MGGKSKSMAGKLTKRNKNEQKINKKREENMIFPVIKVDKNN